MAKNKSIFSEIIDFVWQRKLWWLVPILIMIALVSGLILIGHSSALSPFIYALF